MREPSASLRNASDRVASPLSSLAPRLSRWPGCPDGIGSRPWVSVPADPSLAVALRGKYLDVCWRGRLPCAEAIPSGLGATTHAKCLITPESASQVGWMAKRYGKGELRAAKGLPPVLRQAGIDRNACPKTARRSSAATRASDDRCRALERFIPACTGNARPCVPSTSTRPEVRDRAVRMVLQHQGEYASQWAKGASGFSTRSELDMRPEGAMTSIAAKIGCTGETLRSWAKRSW